MTVVKRGRKFVLLSGTGKVLGTHPTRAKAERQEKAIKASEAAKKKRRP